MLIDFLCPAGIYLESVIKSLGLNTDLFSLKFVLHSLILIKLLLLSDFLLLSSISGGLFLLKMFYLYFKILSNKLAPSSC